MTRERNLTDKLEVDCALILPPSPLQCSVLRVLKLVKVTQTGENSKQRYDVTGDRTRDLSHRRPRTDQQLCGWWAAGGSKVSSLIPRCDLKTLFRLLSFP